jgi:hypothetical protein
VLDNGVTLGPQIPSDDIVHEEVRNIMPDAERVISQTFMTAMTNFAMIRSFRRIAHLGFARATPVVHKESFALAATVYEGTEYDRFFLDKPGALRAMGDQQVFGATVAENQLDRFQAGIDAASLIFAHSVLDAAALEYCRATAITSPSSWEPFVEKKQLALASIKGRDYESILQDEIRVSLETLERQSLMTKIDRLFQVCRPGSDFGGIKNYQLDRERLSQLDKLRHEVVHRPGTVRTLPRGDDDLWFLEQTSAFLLALVHMRFGLRVDSTKVF